VSLLGPEESGKLMAPEKRARIIAEYAKRIPKYLCNVSELEALLARPTDKKHPLAFRPDFNLAQGMETLVLLQCIYPYPRGKAYARGNSDLRKLLLPMRQLNGCKHYRTDERIDRIRRFRGTIEQRLFAECERECRTVLRELHEAVSAEYDRSDRRK